MKTTYRTRSYHIFILLFFGILFSNAQEHSKFENCDLQQKNSDWLDKILVEKNNNSKIAMIKSKIESDTVYIPAIRTEIKLHDNSLNFEVKNKNENLCGIKIMFVLEFGKHRNINLDLLQNPEYKIIVQNINKQNVKLWILNRKDGLAIYGTSGGSGVVFIRTKDKNLKKIIKQTLKKTPHNSVFAKNGVEFFL
ncbi:hypothetical protein EIB71_00060 [Kaistella daneshvariae]|uniref:Uncharacterized protein n=1 Tax=Kaistella daneshvariae TaxID=2487074 RepID=A0ABM7C5C0_9FLAO|nr:hypothetical protein [Kaistella daneshvariae]AZI66168.1 hypothetical protein EIB71_00060 [Kaistella daneshvariae]